MPKGEGEVSYTYIYGLLVAQERPDRAVALSLGLIITVQVQGLHKLSHCRNGGLVLDHSRHWSENLHQ